MNNVNNELNITTDEIQEAVRGVLNKSLRNKHELITSLVEQALDDRLSDIVDDLMGDTDIENAIRDAVKMQILATVPEFVETVNIDISLT